MASRRIHRRSRTSPPSGGRGTSPSSWTATAAGPSGRAAADRRTSPRRRHRPPHHRRSARLEIEQLTLYCLSSENWKRPQPELDFLMHLLEQYMIEERVDDHGAQHPRQRDRPPRRDPRPGAREMDKTIAMSTATPAPGCAWPSTTAVGRSIGECHVSAGVNGSQFLR